ncbi:hypothetical protein GF357_03480 [Candidatus Dojkabacteria bacterium]|nr:hypothetical protein [Candidatus Dojkabacteria bacterium]
MNPSISPEQAQQMNESNKLHKRSESLVKSFQVIGLLSIMNGVLVVLNTGIYFPIGLGVTGFIQGLIYGIFNPYPDLENIVISPA